MMSGFRNILWLLPLIFWLFWPLWGGPVSRFLSPGGGSVLPGGGQVAGQTAAAGGGFVMEGVLFSQMKDGALDWQIRAGQLYAGKNPNLLHLKGVEAQVFKNAARRLLITGREGEYDSKNKLLLMRDRVSVQTANGLVVQTDRLSYDDRLRKITTRSPVEISGRNLEIRGQGLDYDLAHDSYQVSGRVKVDIR